MLYNRLKGASSIPTNDFAPPPSPLHPYTHTSRHFRKHHSLAFQIPLLIATFTRAVSSPLNRKVRLFPQTISD